QGAVLKAPAGAVNMASTASPGEASFDANDHDIPIDTSKMSGMSDIDLSQSSTVDVSGEGGGRIVVAGNNIEINNSFLSALNLGATAGRGIQIDARGTFTLS